MLEPQTPEGSALVSKVEQPRTTENGKMDMKKPIGGDDKDWDNRDNL